MTIFNRLGFFFVIFPILFSLNAPLDFPYQIQHGTPVSIQNFVDVTAGCNWTGVAGQVFDKNRVPKIGLTVEIHGVLGGSSVNLSSVTGSAVQMGPGGFELKLADGLVGSSGAVYLQLFDPGGGPLSDKIYFSTYSDCEHNLVLVNMIEFAPISDIYFPLLFAR